MPLSLPKSSSLRWLCWSALGLAGCLRPIPPQAAQGTSGGSSASASSSLESSSSTSVPDTSESTKPSSSDTQDEETDSQESKKEVVPRHELRRLTPTQLRNALQGVFSKTDSGTFDAAVPIPIIYSNDAFANDVRYQLVSPESLAKIQETAQALGDYVSASTTLRAFARCKASTSDINCAKSFISTIGGQLFRRPLSPPELENYLELYRLLLAKDGETLAFAGLVQALASSPYLHYLPPRTEPAQHAYLVAARLSLFLWNDLPDQALTKAARDNRLLDPKVLLAQAQRMLASPKANRMIRDFYLQMLRLGAMQVRSHPHANRAQLLDSFGAHIEQVYEKDNLEALWTLPVSFEGQNLTEHFPGQYPGLLAHPVFNWIHAKPTYSDPIARGAVIREQIFCNALRAPPPDVQMLLPAPNPDATTRERFEIHRKDPACASCHSLIDPLGFGLEAYDHLGRYRQKENDKPIDDRGALVATDVNGPFQGLPQLGEKLVQSVDVRQCLAEQWLSYALGRPPRGADQALLESLRSKLAAKEGVLSELLLTIATSSVITYQEPGQ